MRELLPFVKDFGGTVIELGSRDGHDALTMSTLFHADRVITIEANPECYEDIQRTYPQFENYNCAINNRTGPVEFFAMSHDNPSWALGQSSLLNRDIYDRGATKIVVDGLTMDDFTDINNITSIEAMKIDVEGATFQVLEGFTKLRMTRLLHVELEESMYWPGQKLYADTEKLLKDYKYERVYFKYAWENQSDSIWLRKDHQ